MDKNADEGSASSTAPPVNPGVLTALALILTGLGTPLIIDGLETARGLDIPRDWGVLPWLFLDALGLGLLVRYLTPRMRQRLQRPLGRRRRRRGLIWAALASVAALELPPLFWPGVVVALKAGPAESFYKAMAGHWAVAAALGILVFAAYWYKGGATDGGGEAGAAGPKRENG